MGDDPNGAPSELLAPSSTFFQKRWMLREACGEPAATPPSAPPGGAGGGGWQGELASDTFVLLPTDLVHLRSPLWKLLDAVSLM